VKNAKLKLESQTDKFKIFDVFSKNQMQFGNKQDNFEEIKG